MKNQDDTTLENAYEQIYENHSQKQFEDEKNEQQLLEEGLWDRVKGVASGIQKAAGRGFDSFKDEDTKDFKTVGKEITTGFRGGQTSSVIKSHVSKLNAQIDDFINDLVKVGNVTENSVSNYQQSAEFLKGIIKKLAKTSGRGSASVGSLKTTLGQAGFLHPSEQE